MNTIAQFHRSTKKQHGQMGIIGTILGLVIIGLVLFYVFTHFGSAKNNQGSQAVSSDLISAAGKLQGSYASNPQDAANVTAQVVANLSVFPKGEVSNGNINTSYGTLTAAGSAADANVSGSPSITLTYPSVPASQCVDFVNAVSGTAGAISVGGTIVKSSSVPMSATSLGTQCQTLQAAGTGSVALTIAV